MADPTDIWCEANRSGTGYELAMQLGPRDDAEADARLLAALRALWASAALHGCYRQPAGPPPDHRSTPSTDLTLEDTVVHGIADLPGRRRAVCVSYVVREEGPGAFDWLDLAIPSPVLGAIEPRLSLPMVRAETWPWREPIDRWFVDRAREVAAVVPFRLALVGEEVSGADWMVRDAEPHPWVSVLRPVDGDVEWMPPTTTVG